MSFLTQGRTLAIGVAIILMVNAIALAGIAYNRSGSPDSRLHLSQRELSLPWQSDDENSGIALKLKWRVLGKFDSTNKNEWQQRLYGLIGNEPAWLDATKLRSLGFDVRPPVSTADDHQDYRPQPRREVLLVLELDGPTYQQSVAQAKIIVAKANASANANANVGVDVNPDVNAIAMSAGAEASKALIREEQENSRLFVVDAGLDTQVLRAKYPDRSHYAIVRGTVRPQWKHLTRQEQLLGNIDQLSIDTINVPVTFRRIFESAAGKRYINDGEPNAHPFEADVAFGKRFEPWIVKVSGQR